jgi:four helix bundle protein
MVKLSQFLCDEKKEFILSKQVLRSGTSIGALIREAEFGQSRADTDYISEKMFEVFQTIAWSLSKCW